MGRRGENKMFPTPMRYPGGKGRLTQYVIDIIKLNKLVGGHYVEPYAGGAGVAIALLYLEYAAHIHLNDLNRSVYSFWKSVCEEPEALCKLVRDKPLTVGQWKKHTRLQTAKDVSTLELGFSTLYLNRTNRSGIITGGIIGGKDQTGNWKLDARFNRVDLIRRIEKIASYSPRITLYNMDAAQFINEKLASVPKRSLVYLDPPYYRKGSKLYEDHYQRKDHAIIAELVAKIKQKWIVSYDNVPAIRKLYSEFEQETFGLCYSAHSRYKGREVMISCANLETPMSVRPWRGIAA
jgi:DNA adenine methylase